MIDKVKYGQFQDHKILPGTAAFFRIAIGDQPHSLGTGTFVSMGNIRGLLTCAHVLDALLAESHVGLAIFPVRSSQRLYRLDTGHCDRIKFGPSWDQNGPDLAFLRLPIPFFNQIAHLISVKSLEAGRTHAFAPAEPSPESITAVVGIIHEWVKWSDETNDLTVSGLVNIGSIQDRTETGDGHDLFCFQPSPDEDFPMPRSFEGTSGGGLWRVYPKPDDGGEPVYRLIGVAFYETNDRQVICHGQASVYVKLFDAIRVKWPDAR